MDWFKHLKRSGTPTNFASINGGKSVVWNYKFNFPFLKLEYTPSLQAQVFEKGFDSPKQGVGVEALEIRISILLVPGEVGYNATTGIFLDKSVLDLDRSSLWSALPKEEMTKFLDANRGKIYSCFMKAIFEFI